jgi:hypothetical protein
MFDSRLRITTVALGPGLALLPHHLGVDARAQDRPGAPVDMGDNIEIDEAVVDRRDQRVGVGMRQPRQIAVGSRAVHHQIVGLLRQLADDRLEPHPVLLHRRFAVDVLRRCQEEVPGHRQRGAGLQGGGAIREIARQGPLPGVQVDGPDLVAEPQEGDDQMHRRGRLSGPALLAPDHDDVGRRRRGGRRSGCTIFG